jgi:predicted transcriptional regulator
MTKKRAFGELESQIMILLKSGERRSVKEIHQALGGTDNYNTVMTVMSRLAEKGSLAREKVGLHYEYWSLASPGSVLDKIKQKLFGAKTSALVSYLMESADDLTDQDLAEMEALIQKRRLKKNDQ